MKEITQGRDHDDHRKTTPRRPFALAEEAGSYEQRRCDRELKAKESGQEEPGRSKIAADQEGSRTRDKAQGQAAGQVSKRGRQREKHQRCPEGRCAVGPDGLYKRCEHKVAEYVG